MSSILPSHGAAGIQSKNYEYRLYIQYKSTDVDICERGFVCLLDFGCILVEIKDYPINTCIRPASQSIKEVLKDLSSENVFNIIIDGGSQEKLNHISKFYTSLEYWNSDSYLKDMNFNHQSRTAAIKQVIKRRGKEIDTLVLSSLVPVTSHSQSQIFYGPPKMGSRYTLHVKYNKYDTFKQLPKTEWKVFSFRNLPISCSILEVDGRTNAEFFTGPTIEFIIKSDDLSLLKEIKCHSTNPELPSSKCTYMTFHLEFNEDCIETGHKSPQTDKYIINFGKYKSGFLTYLHYC